MATLEETGNICLLEILINHLFIMIAYYLVHFLVLGMLFEYLYYNLYQKDLFNSMIPRILKSRPLNLSLYFLWSDCHNKMCYISVLTKFTVSCCSPGWMFKLPRKMCYAWPGPAQSCHLKSLPWIRLKLICQQLPVFLPLALLSLDQGKLRWIPSLHDAHLNPGSLIFSWFLLVCPGNWETRVVIPTCH